MPSSPNTAAAGQLAEPDASKRLVPKLVIVTRALPAPVEARMRTLFACRLNASDTPMTADALRAAAGEAHVLVPTVTDAVDRAVIAAAGPDLRLIASFGAGTDHIDLAACAEKGIVVTNTPDVLTEDTADATMALILSVCRRLSEGERRLRAGGWTGWRPTGLLGQRLRGRRLGIVGMGRIGRAVAARAQGFGLSVHYHNRGRAHAAVEAELDATWWPDLDAMLAQMDIVSLNCPHTAETHHLLDARRLSLMKADACVVNTSRGDIIDEAALADALRRGALGGAGLDVYETEPQVHPGLLALENVTLLPHMGSATREGRVAMGERVLVNIRAFLDGHTPPDRVLGG